jgi:thymidylate kinase
MNIVFEGVEGVGKTTTIQKLAELLEKEGIKYNVFKQPKQEYLQLYKKFQDTPYHFCPFLLSLFDDHLNDIYNASKTVNIFDRGLLSIWIYNFKAPDKYFMKFTRKLISYSLVIVLTADIKDILTRVKKREKEWDSFDKNLLKKRNSLFFKLASKYFKDKFLYYNTSLMKPDEIAKSVLDNILQILQIFNKNFTIF